MADVYIKEERGRSGHRDPGKREAEMGVMQLQAKECPDSPEAGRGAWNRLSCRDSRRNQPCQHPDLSLLASRTVRQYISVVLSRQVVEICYANPRKLIHLLTLQIIY